MTYEPGYLREKSKELTTTVGRGIRLIGLSVGTYLLVSEYQRIRSLGLDVMDYAYLGLLFFTGCLVLLWIWAVQRELEFLFTWLDAGAYVPPSSMGETVIILGFAGFLTALLFASRNPFAYGIIFTVYSAASIPGAIYVNRQLREAIDASRNRALEDMQDGQLAPKARVYLEAIAVLEAYFLKRPIVLRLYVILAASLAALGLAIWWQASKARSVGFLAYLAFILIILISELVIGWWRIVRDNKLRSVDMRLLEIQRETSSNCQSR
ncbi:MAG: hypothetical protein PHU85_15390 [Phycisphaerae bacterium]|nr:hypothetical protein [Phycisphaerae bacterium]